MCVVSTVQAVLFDLDGVLIDSEPVWERVRREFVERMGGHWNTQIQEQMMGVRTSEWSAALSELLGGSLTPTSVADLVVEEMAASYRRSLPLIQGAVETVHNLALRFRLGLASGSPRSLIKLALQLADLAHIFEVFVSTDELSHGKPMPDPYVYLAHRLGLEPQECAAVEDSANGLRSAFAAQARVVAIPRGQYLPDRETLTLAHTVLKNIIELTPDLVAELP
jgi:HAD superfamily hydrolase (TIGR01509 family)